MLGSFGVNMAIKNNSMTEKIFELKRDVWYPGHYFRAGMRRTEAEWKEIFAFNDIRWESDWFIDLTKQEQDILLKDELGLIIEDVFSRKKLNSITYKEAARMVAEQFLKIYQSQPNEKQQENTNC